MRQSALVLLTAMLLGASSAALRAQDVGVSSATQDAFPVLELSPLVITAPRLKLPPHAILDPRIDLNLLRLLARHENERPNPTAQLDANLNILSQLTTLDGYNLQTRYTQLGFLLTQGLAGSTDIQIQQALIQAAQGSANTQIQASALLALAYTKDPQFLGLFMNALQSPNITIRFGALESLMRLGGMQVRAAMSNDAATESSLIAQAYAADYIWRKGDVSGQNILLNLYQNNNWIVRAMAYHYLGREGRDYEYTLLLPQLQIETNPIARAELCAALLRLRRFHQGT